MTNYNIVYGTNCYRGNTKIESVDLGGYPWVDNSMIGAFSWCTRLSNVQNINNNVTEMTDSFFQCSNLLEPPVLPSSVKNMTSTFGWCSKLSNMPDIPNGVINMGGTFGACTNLTNMKSLPDTVNYASSLFEGCSNLTNVVDLDNTQIIDISNGFQGTNISITPKLPATIKNIYQTFDSCYNLSDVSSLPYGVEDLSKTFCNCISLVNIPNIPYTVLNMSESFKQADLLSGDIYIDSKNIIDATNCFDNTSLNKDVYIYFKDRNDEYTTTYNSFISAGYSDTVRVNGALLINRVDNPEWRYTVDPTNGVRILEEYLWSNTIINVPQENSVINDCTTNYSNTTDSNSPFHENQNIIGVELDYVEWVNNSMAYSFYNDYNLRYIHNISANVTNYHLAFWNCTNLVEITVPYSFFDNSSGGGTGGSTDITNAFDGCINLVTINVEQDPNNRFDPAIGSTNTTTNVSGTFQNTPITTIPTLPGTITDMSWAFANCYHLNIASGIPVSVVNMQGTFYNCYNLSNCSSIVSTDLNDMSMTFWNCTNLTDIGLIASAVNMYQTFYNCSNITKVASIPENVEDMCETFSGCSNLYSIPSIPGNVTNMSGTFDGCTSLTGALIIHSTEITNAYNCFDNTTSDKNIYIVFEYENGESTETYSAFRNAGYSSETRVNGVLLKDIAGFDIDLTDYDYENPKNSATGLYDILLTKYTGVGQTEITTPHLEGF